MNGAKAPRGGELFTVSLIESLREDLFNPVVICAEENIGVARLKGAGVKTFRIPLDNRITSIYPRGIGLRNCGRVVEFLGQFAKSRCLDTVTRLLKESGADLLYCADNLSKLIGKIAARRVGIKVIGHCHDVLQHDVLGCTLKAFNLLLLDKIIAVSEAVRKSFPSSGPYGSKVVTIHNGVDIRRFDPASVGPLIEKDLLFPEGTVVVAMIGTLDENKGHIYLLRAVQKLKSEGVMNLKVLIVGQGPEEQALKSYCKEMAVEEEVLFLGFRQDVTRILKMVSILVMPTLYYESYGLAAAEAMAMGVPVIGTRVGAIPELVVNGQTGLLIPPGDEEALCNAITYLIDRPDLRREMGRHGRARILEKFSLEKTIARIEEVFLALLRKDQKTGQCGACQRF
jgi:glycosyltransferase involved in cell wall biosynthesis